MSKIGPFALIIASFISINGMAKKQVNVADFGINAQTADCTSGLIKSLHACKDEGDTELMFNKGVYNFYPDFGVDKYCFITNNDEGLKRVIFLLEGIKNLTIDGQGSTFIFHGFVNPFVINNSNNITFKNFSIDFARSFHSEGIILANNADGMDIDIPENFPYRINNGTLLFTNDKSEQQGKTILGQEIIYPYSGFLEFDTKKRETAYMAQDLGLANNPLLCKSIGDRKVRIYQKDLKGTVGNAMVFASDNRNYPGFAVSDSKDIRFENITIFHAGGMGFVCQFTKNVALISCKVIPSQGRMVSCTADATHFTNCTGKIEFGNCVFKNQMDDATNIHGLYVQIADQLAQDEVIVQLKHYQQVGLDFLKPGTSIEFVKGNSLITKGYAKVVDVKRLNKNFTRIKLSNALPADIKVGDAIAEVNNSQFVYIHENYIGNNRARGLLLNCYGKTIVENNIFHTPGAGILFEGEASHWFEKGGVTDCTIQNNIFENCLYGVWGKAVIDVGAGIKENLDVSRYNKNIKILNNTFRTFDEALLLQAYCVDGLIWKGNKVEINKEYPASRNNKSLFKVENSDNIKIEK